MIPFIVFGSCVVAIILFLVAHWWLLAREDARANEPWAPGDIAICTRLQLISAGQDTQRMLERAAAILAGAS